ncbi:MAG: Rrf2 family transcriptional regulator [Clostridia bacterium]|nr:Rrf2 family transcriptional regulator [Clostridia bacterium]
MKLSVKAKYGLTACINLAENYEKGNLTVSQLSGKVGTTDKFLEQIMAMLKKAEVVSSTRGAFGGYTLTKSPKETTVGQILRAEEDNLQIIDCMGAECKCNEPCSSQVVWVSLQKTINDYLDSITLDSLIKGEK